jgi:alkanesulfonate monooxygenase SsuD/methylene tetrahydromethanopterin reductase-like flavin-dependent oxidoreductase (luciferase family)
MRIGRADGRLVLIDGDEVIDVAAVSDGEFGPDPDRVFAMWDRWTGRSSWSCPPIRAPATSRPCASTRRWPASSATTPVNCSHIAARDSFTTLAGLAHLAPSVTLATSVAPIYHRSPASMAQTAATVDDLSGGRFGLPFYRAMFAQAGYEADVAAGVARYRATGATNPMITNITGTDLGATMRAAISD